MASTAIAAKHLNLSNDVLADAQVVRYELPLARAGEGAAGVPADADADHRQGNLRVRVMMAEGLPEGSQPSVTVAVAELTRRRARRTATAARGPNAEWNEAFDFEATSACAQVVLDVWDRPADSFRKSQHGKRSRGLGCLFQGQVEGFPPAFCTFGSLDQCSLLIASFGEGS